MKRTGREPAHPSPARDSFLQPALLIFAVALAVRLIHAWQIREAPFFSVLMGDSRAYDAWAREIAAGDWLGHDVFYQAPLYPYFLGTLYAAAGRDLLIVRICQALMGSAACVLLGLACRRFFSKPAGAIAGLMLALYAPAIFFDGLIQKSALDVFLISVMLWLLSRLAAGHDPRGRSTWLWLGVVLGALSLTRENALVFTGVILLWAMVRGGAPRRRRLADAGVFLIGLSLVLVPVAVRNRVVGGGFVLTTAQLGPNFYIGNNARADGTYKSLRFGRGAPEYERQDATEMAERAAGRRLAPAEVSRYWTGRATAFISAQPAAWLRLLGRKTLLVWNASEMLDTESQETHAEWSLPLRVAGRIGHFGVLVPLALVGVIVTWQARARLWVLYAMPLAYAASVVLFYVFARYRFPLVPFLVAFASAGLAAAPRFVRASSIPQTAAALAVVAVAAVFANWPTVPGDLMRAVTENNLGVALQAEGRLDEAIGHYRRAIALRPDYAPAYNNMATALRSRGRSDEAVAAYERALGLQPDYPEAHYNLANALLDRGRLDQAVGHFERALQSIPASADVHNNLGVALAGNGRLDEAVKEFREALRLDPGSAKAHRNLGDALASQRNPEAVAHLQRAVQLEPANGPTRYDLGSVLLEAGRLDEAVAEFRAALALMPESVEAYNNLGIALASQGKLDEAIDQFRRALGLRPAFEDARRNLTMALQARKPARKD